MKSILISIKPEWIAKILNGDKTIEIRKTKPSIDLPIKVYIYCTYGSKLTQELSEEEYQELKAKNPKSYIITRPQVLNGKIVAEFMVNKIDEIKMPINFTSENPYETSLLKKSLLTSEELIEYLGWRFFKNFFAWHIDNLKIYDEPNELSEFKTPEKVFHKIIEKADGSIIFADGYTGGKKLTKAPQSWQYVEVKDEAI